MKLEPETRHEACKNNKTKYQRSKMPHPKFFNGVRLISFSHAITISDFYTD